MYSQSGWLGRERQWSQVRAYRSRLSRQEKLSSIPSFAGLREAGLGTQALEGRPWEGKLGGAKRHCAGARLCDVPGLAASAPRCPLAGLPWGSLFLSKSRLITRSLRCRVRAVDSGTSSVPQSGPPTSPGRVHWQTPGWPVSLAEVKREAYPPTACPFSPVAHICAV